MPSIGGSFTGGSFTGGTSAGGVGGTIPTGGTAFTGGTGGAVPRGGSSFGGTSGTTGTGGCFSGPPPTIPWDFAGRIDAGQNPYGINGSWYTFDDCADASLAGLSCTVRNPNVLGPDGSRGWTVVAPSAVCASGTAPRVERGRDGAPAYSLQWGFGMGFSLNQGAPFDTVSQCIRGFAFQLVGNAPLTVRVNVVTPTTIGVSHFMETALSLNSFVDFTSARQGAWVMTPTMLDARQITDIQFHVHTNEFSETPFEFCVNDLRVLL